MPTATKIDYRRELLELYAPPGAPAIVEVPGLSYLMADGHGDPNIAPEFSEAIEALYAVAYAAKFAVKRAPEGVDYGVMPLEGLFWTPDPSTTLGSVAKFALHWTLMIMQPGQVTVDVFDEAQASARKRKSPEVIDRIRLERFAEGLAAQVLHVGPYAAQGPTIQLLHAFIAERGYERAGKHHEVYLSDPRRAAPDKIKTIIRQPIAAAG